MTSNFSKTLSFLEFEERPESALFDDPKWVAALAFLVDMTGHLNELNTSMQGRDHLFPDLYDKVKAFEMKLNLWERSYCTECCALPMPSNC